MTVIDGHTAKIAATSCGPDDCIPGNNCQPDIECSPRSHVTSPVLDADALANACTPDFSTCNPNWCIPVDRAKAPGFLWLDLTRKCQLECLHCYNASGPDGDHGTMEREDWFRVIDEAKAAGVGKIQLIGGEPTMHPHFVELLEHALSAGLQVEVYSNLVYVKPEWWGLFQQPGVSLATSYYSDDPDEHNAITKRPSHLKTVKNIRRALELKIPLRAGVVALSDEQRSAQAVAELKALGVTVVGVDRLRHFGRGQENNKACDVNELCGNCGDGRAAIGPDGSVTPCIMSSWLKAGSVKTTALAGILAGEGMARATATIPRRPAAGNVVLAPICQPTVDPCTPQECHPYGGEEKHMAAGPCDPGAECAPDAYPCQPG